MELKITYSFRHCAKSVQIRCFFWSVFSRIWTEYGVLLRNFPYSVQIRENTDQKKLRFGLFFTQRVKDIILLSRKKAMTNRSSVSKVFILNGIKRAQLTLFFVFFFSKAAPSGKIQTPSATIGATSSTQSS